MSGTPILTSIRPACRVVSCRTGPASEADSAQHGMARPALHVFTLQNKPCRDVRCRASPLNRVSVNTVKGVPTHVYWRAVESGGRDNCFCVL